MHNKIIKYALVLLATASSIFAWTQATEIQNCQTKEYSRGTAYTDCFEFAPNETLTYNGQYNEINNKMSFLYDSTYNIFHMEGYDYGCKTTIYRDENKKLSGILEGNGGCTAGATLYEYKKICKTNYKTYTGIIQECFSDGSIFNTAIANTDIQEFYEENGTIEKYLFIPRNMRYSRSDETTSISAGALCTIFTDNSYCVPIYRTNSRENDGIASGKNINSLTNGTAYTQLQSNNLLSATSPFAGGSNGGGNTPITQYSCPTIQQLINTYGEQYNTGLCYSSTLIYTGGTIQTIEPKTIFELYPTYTGFTQAINLYYNYCTPPATQETCNTAFQGNELGRTIINKLPSDAKNSHVYQYCNLQLNYEDKNATTCTLQQTLAPGITINDVIQEIGNQDISVVTPGTPPEGQEGNGSGSVFDNLIGENTEDTERRNIIENAKNIIKTMKELYAKFTAIFRGRNGTEGFIPEYITGMLLLIILYKLFKK